MITFGSGRVWFWTRHRRASYPCFCWMPTVTSPKIHDQNRSERTAAKKHIQWPVFGRTLGPFTNTQIDFARLPAAIHVHRCCALHHDGDRLQLAAAPGRRDHRPIQVCLSASAYIRNTRKRQDHQWDKNKLTQGALFAQDRTLFLARVEDARRHDEAWTHLTVTDFWAKLNQVLVDAGADLYAKESKAKISTPQDTLDARHDRTEAKLEVMRLPPRRLPKNQMRDSDLPSNIERRGHIFTQWRTCSTWWRSTATVRRLQRRDKTKKHTEQAQRISDAWDQRDFSTLWSAARAMLSHPCGPKRRRHDIPLSSLPTAAAWATHLRQAGPSRLRTKVVWEAPLLEAKSQEQQAARWAASGRVPGRTGGVKCGFSWYGSASSTVTSSTRDSGLASGDNTPKKHGVGYKTEWLAPFFRSRLWQRTGCAPMWCTGVSLSRLTKVTIKIVATGYGW